jgi:hypothetical protein
MDGFGFIPGDERTRSAPLTRYLPPVPSGLATAFLEQHAGFGEPKRGAWILDPFGASPELAIEMARLNYCVLVAVNNPVTQFLLEMAANPPSQADLQAALAELSAARKGEERMETHLQSLYLTDCNRCQQEVPAEAFVWERQSGALIGRIYHCSCGDSGEYPAGEADRQRAARLAATDGLHRSRAIERVARPGDPDRHHAEEALECYLPRAVYALITIINKLDSLMLSVERRRALLALVLSACDEASTLWPHPADRPRPKQLIVPTRFLEKNVWLALERGVELWSGNEKPIHLTKWPATPGESGGICLFEGPVRNLAPQLKELPIGVIVTAVPRPNQAFWTLSALWAGWLWGQEAAAPFKSVLRRRRYDWSWHAAALYAALKNLSDHLPLNAPIFALVPEAEPAFLSAVLLAAAGARFDLNGLAMRSRFDPLQILWHRQAFSHDHKEEIAIDPDSVQQAIQSALQERGEPAPYLALHAAGLAAMAFDHSLQWQEEALNQVHAPILAALERTEFIHHAESSNPETGLWGLVDWDADVEPLSDRVEVAVVRYLQNKTACTQRDLETTLNTVFTGLQTPSLGLIRAVLTSYAIETNGLWSLRPEDFPSSRRTDLEAVAQSLAVIGTRLGYGLEQAEKPHRQILWRENGEVTCAFHLLASAVCGSLLRSSNQPSSVNNFLVIPGGRAGLLAYKLSRDPSLADIARQWRVVKFRHLRRLAEVSGLTRETFEKNLSSDPIEPPEQMKLF